MICQKACSNEVLGTTLFNDLFAVIKIKDNGTYYFEDVQFFKEIYGSAQIEENNEVTTEQRRINPNDMDMQGVSKTVWEYYYASKEEELLDKESLEYDYVGEAEWGDVTPVYNAYEKTATIEASQSNRFNILQDIAEKFQCWVRFIIEHNEDGSIKEDNEGNLCKYVTLLRENGEHTGVNFNYGVDLQGVKRNLKSSNIATKTIVLQNNNEFGQNGFCTIARSPWNYTKENVIYNFDYYIDQGLLDEEQLNKDLYEAPNGYFYILHENNEAYDEITDIIIKKNTEYNRVFSSRALYSQYLTSAEKQRTQIQNNLMRLANANSWENTLSYAKTHSDNTKVQTLLNSYYSILKDVEKYQDSCDALDRSLEILDQELTDLESEQAEYLRTTEMAHAAFYRKYSRFIQEGVWNSEDYYDDSKYYLDAVSVAYESSRPQIEYDISIVRLSDLDEYSSKMFDLGDICTVQDIKYFGYQADGITPHKEEVFISEITSFFDTPDKDTFKVQNYKSNFDDLFQRITATTQSLQFSEGKYARAAGALNSNGTIKYSVLQDTFDKNKDLVMGSLNDSVLIDNRGITVTNADGGVGQVRITSGGIFVTEDGGATWKNAVRGDGISADVLTAGQINTEQISIYGSDAPSFIWDDKGISAYLINAGTGATDLSQYVRFDKYGLYGISGNDNFAPQSENDIYNNASFGLTWNRFFMKNSSETGNIEISSDNDILVHGVSGNQLIDRVRIGHLQYTNDDDEDVDDYGILIYDEENNPVFWADSNGVKISGNVHIGDFTAGEIVSTASSAVTIANNAAAAAASASALAGSKNTVYYTTASASPSGSFQDGDVWIQTQTSSSTQDGIAGSRLMYLYENNQWNQVKFGTGSLVAGTVVADLIAGNAITAGKIDTGAVTAEQIAAHTITVDELDMGSINASQSIKVGAFSTSLTNSLASNEQLIYIQATSAASPPSAFPPSATSSSSYWITNSGESVVGTASPTWTLKHPTYSSAYPVTYVAKQKISVDGIISCTTPLRDDSTTVIDGGNITTGSIDAARITTGKLNANYIKLGGKMDVFKTATSADVGGNLGYISDISYYVNQNSISENFVFESGTINSSGNDTTGNYSYRSKNYLPVSGGNALTITFVSPITEVLINEYKETTSSDGTTMPHITQSTLNAPDTITLDSNTTHIRCAVVYNGQHQIFSSSVSRLVNISPSISTTITSTGIGLLNDQSDNDSPLLRLIQSSNEEAGLYEFIEKYNGYWFNKYSATLQNGLFSLSPNTKFGLPPGQLYGYLKDGTYIPWFTTFWTNTTPGSGFESHDESNPIVTVPNLSLYDYIIVEICYNNKVPSNPSDWSGVDTRRCTIFKNTSVTSQQAWTEHFMANLTWYDSGKILAVYRSFWVVNNTKICCNTGTWTSPSSTSDSKNYAIPTRIMGIMGSVKEV